MARIESTGGDVCITVDNCDCGLTGGCEKCQPIHFSTTENVVTTFIPKTPVIPTYSIFYGRTTTYGRG